MFASPHFLFKGVFMKRFRKQIIAACLVAVIFTSTVLVPAKPAYAIAGVDDAAFILAMLAAAGAGFVCL